TVYNHGGSPGMRFGVNKFSDADQHVIPANIIVRQRGTPIQCLTFMKMSRDHTIYEPGFVRFYKGKWIRGERRFVGLLLDRGEVLPRDELRRGRSRFCGLVNLKDFVSPQPIQSV
ncbi:hypothetical protein B0H13DRAFT_1632142, partial [Mycena leptocephala]